MNFLKVTFPLSGVTTWIFLPPLITFLLAFFGVMGGITGAFLLLPFQFSILGYQTPGVSATNLLYNLLTIPPALWRFRKERRFYAPLALLMLSGVIPGLFLGYLVRIHWLASPQRFRLLVGMVLLYLCSRILKDLRKGQRKVDPARNASSIEYLPREGGYLRFRFGATVYRVPILSTLIICLLVGTVSGAYGIGGGAILAPYLVSILRLPVHAVAGATLASTFGASVCGVLFYTLGPGSGPLTRPDWALGLLFGLGGLAGAYLGARCQKYVPERPIKWGLFLATGLGALKYLWPYLLLLLKG